MNFFPETVWKCTISCHKKSKAIAINNAIFWNLSNHPWWRYWGFSGNNLFKGFSETTKNFWNNILIRKIFMLIFMTWLCSEYWQEIISDSQWISRFQKQILLYLEKVNACINGYVTKEVVCFYQNHLWCYWLITRFATVFFHLPSTKGLLYANKPELLKNALNEKNLLDFSQSIIIIKWRRSRWRLKLLRPEYPPII